MNKAKRFLSALLVLLLCVGIFPAAAASADMTDDAAEAAACTDPVSDAAAEADGPAAPQSGFSETEKMAGTVMTERVTQGR